MFEEGSKLEEIGLCCFQDSGLEEITLPKSLKEVDDSVFCNCKCLRIIYVEDKCEAELYLAGVPDST